VLGGPVRLNLGLPSLVFVYFSRFNKQNDSRPSFLVILPVKQTSAPTLVLYYLRLLRVVFFFPLFSCSQSFTSRCDPPFSCFSVTFFTSLVNSALFPRRFFLCAAIPEHCSTSVFHPPSLSSLKRPPIFLAEFILPCHNLLSDTPSWLTARGGAAYDCCFCVLLHPHSPLQWRSGPQCFLFYWELFKAHLAPPRRLLCNHPRLRDFLLFLLRPGFLPDQFCPFVVLSLTQAWLHYLRYHWMLFLCLIPRVPGTLFLPFFFPLSYRPLSRRLLLFIPRPSPPPGTPPLLFPGETHQLMHVRSGTIPK